MRFDRRKEMLLQEISVAFVFCLFLFVVVVVVLIFPFFLFFLFYLFFIYFVTLRMLWFCWVKNKVGEHKIAKRGVFLFLLFFFFVCFNIANIANIANIVSCFFFLFLFHSDIVNFNQFSVVLASLLASFSIKRKR